MISSPQIVEAKSGYWSHRISTTWSKQECRKIVRTANNMTKLNKLFATKGNSVSKAVSRYFGVGWSNMIKPFRTAVNRGTGVTISYTWNVPKAGPVATSYASNSRVTYR